MIEFLVIFTLIYLFIGVIAVAIGAFNIKEVGDLQNGWACIILYLIWPILLVAFMKLLVKNSKGLSQKIKDGFQILWNVLKNI